MSELSFMEKLLVGVEVEWKALGDVAEYSQTRVDSSCLNATSFVGVDNLIGDKGGRVDATYMPNTKRLTAFEAGDILLGNIRPYLKKIWKATNSGGCSGDVLAVRISENFKSIVSSDYLYYVLSSDEFFSYNMQNAKGAKMPRGNKAAILNYQIPIPCPGNPKISLEIQAEIVRRLDTFNELTTELTTELNDRKKQYNYYRDQLLSFEEGEVEWKTLGDVLQMRAGQHISASKIMPTANNEHSYPCFGGNGIRGFVESKSHDGDHLLIGRQGALCGNVQRMKGQFYATEHAVVVASSDEIDIDWAFHMLTVMNLNQYASQSAQPGLAVGKLQGLKIPVPSLAEQTYAANILEKFHALTNSITEGLPREIELRQKQYEYYRDLLLSFPKPDADVAA